MANQTLFSKHLNSIKFQKEFRKHWRSQSDFKSTNLEIISKPFKVCRISNFLRDESFIENLKSELERHNHKRSEYSDLYRFEKSKDLRHLKGKCIQRLSKSFRTDLLSWMRRNTKIKLNDEVPMTSTRYFDTDYLLCHDDNSIGRRIAYIFYLTNDWSEEDGGTLDLFETEGGSPMEIVKSLIPKYNSLVFFEVVENSYHQVAEVLTSDKCRWSISGWFHGPSEEDFQVMLSSRPTVLMQWNPTEVNLHSWIFNDYLIPNIICQIQEEVELTSATRINKFLKKSIYEQIMNDLTLRVISWRMIGPRDIRHYEIADEQTLPDLLKDFCNLFKSTSFFRLLEKYTGLELIPKKTNDQPRMTLELQRWSSGCYTILHDRPQLENASDKSVDRLYNNVSVDDDATLASTSGLSTSETNMDANGTRRKLKRERIEDSPSPANTPDKKKVARYLHYQGAQFSSKHEHGMDEISSSPEKLSRSGIPTSDSEDSSSPASSPDKKKVARHLPYQGAQFSSKHEHCMDEISSSPEKLSRSGTPTSDSEDSSSPANSPDKKKMARHLHYQGTQFSSEHERDMDEISSSLEKLSRSGTPTSDSESESDGDFVLDVMLHFHTKDAKGIPKVGRSHTIDYVDPNERDGVLIRLPIADNCLSLVYRSVKVARVQKYLNHYYDGYSYTLKCIYYMSHNSD